MSDNFVINEENFEIYAMKAYSAPCLNVSDFHDDLKKIKYIKRLINRYKKTGDLKERLILNHIILLANVFSIEYATRILFYKIDRKNWSELKSFLVHLNYMPKYIYHVEELPINSSDIPINQDICRILEKYE